MRRHRNKAFDEEAYTNSLYLYADKVVVRTYNHRQQAWMESFDRKFKLPD